MLSLGYVHLGNLTIVGFAQNTSSICTMRILHFWIRLISFHFKTCSAETILKEKSYFQRISNQKLFEISHEIFVFLLPISNENWRNEWLASCGGMQYIKTKNLCPQQCFCYSFFLGCLPTHHASNRIILVAHSLQQNEKLSGAMRRATSRINSLSI